MGRAGDDLGGIPAVVRKDAGGITGILDGVECPRLFQYDRSRNALRLSNPSHDICLHELVVSCGSGNDDPWRDATLVLMNAFGDAVKKLRRGIAVAIGWSAQNDDCIEALTVRIAYGCKSARQQGPQEQSEDWNKQACQDPEN